MEKRLYRSRSDSMLGGVCGGLGQYLGIDPVLVRLFFVLLVLAGGSGVLAYIILWLVVPLEGQSVGTPLDQTMRAGAGEMAQRAHAFGGQFQSGASGVARGSLVAGAVLVLLGLMFLVDNLAGYWLPWLSFGSTWPLLLIVVGAALIWRRTKGV